MREMRIVRTVVPDNIHEASLVPAGRAAGDYVLRHPNVADTLRAETLDQIAAKHPELLVTGHVGCRVFLENSLRARARRVGVKHPVVLLAEQMEN